MPGPALRHIRKPAIDAGLVVQEFGNPLEKPVMTEEHKAAPQTEQGVDAVHTGEGS